MDKNNNIPEFRNKITNFINDNLKKIKDKVVFDIGGKSFVVQKSTILKWKWSLFFGLIAHEESELNQVYFIDRNPKYFELILDQLRDEKFNSEELSTDALTEIMEELDFYQISIKDLPSTPNNWNLPKNLHDVNPQTTHPRIYEKMVDEYDKTSSNLIKLYLEIEKEKEILEKQEQQFVKIHERLNEINTKTKSKITLQVSNEKFTTTKISLTSFKNSIFDGIDKDWKKDDEGNYFIDRNSKNFDLIIDYLRYGYFRDFELTTIEKDKLKKDMEALKIPIPQNLA